jgi:hypothetical protein
VAAQVGKCHAEKEAALDGFGVQSAGLLKEFSGFFQMSSTLERHGAREEPSIEIPRTLAADFGVEAFRLVVLEGLVKGEGFFKQAVALFLVHLAERVVVWLTVPRLAD